MGELFSTRNLLEVLADAEQSLCPQSPDSPKPPQRRFACFADLTTEIRLQIWNLTFPPPRDYNISAQRKKSKRYSRPHMCGPQYCVHAPIALFICQESRYETLCWYRRVVRDRMAFGKSIKTETLFYRVGGGDVLCVNLESVIGTKVEETQFDWVKAFLKNNQKTIGEIEQLEIREWRFNDSWREIFEKKDVKFLRELKGLRRLTCVLSTWYRWDFSGERYVGLKDDFEKREEQLKEIGEVVGKFLGGGVVVDVVIGKS